METQLWHKIIFSGVGCFLISFVLATEFVGTNYRVLVGILIEIPFALGELYLIMLAYFIRDWQDLQVSFYTYQKYNNLLCISLLKKKNLANQINTCKMFIIEKIK